MFKNSVIYRLIHKLIIVLSFIFQSSVLYKLGKSLFNFCKELYLNSLLHAALSTPWSYWHYSVLFVIFKKIVAVFNLLSKRISRVLTPIFDKSCFLGPVNEDYPSKSNFLLLIASVFFSIGITLVVLTLLLTRPKTHLLAGLILCLLAAIIVSSGTYILRFIESSYIYSLLIRFFRVEEVEQ